MRANLLAQGRRLPVVLLGFFAKTQQARHMGQHLSIETDEAIQSDILAVERAALLVPARLVMDG